MRAILQKRALRYVFGANMISMLGSGMNSAAVAWYILQATHSEIALGTFAVLQTLPAMLMLPFTGVLIDREDRRRLVMMLDAIRAVIILAVAILAFTGKVKVWQLYLMNTLVAAGFWMFWPTITALIQELTPGEEFVHANTFLLAGIQGGWLIAGSIVGFVYNHIGLGGVLLIDFSTYLVVVSSLPRRAQGTPRGAASGGTAGRHRGRRNRSRDAFVREMREGLDFLRGHRPVVTLGSQLGAFSGRDDDGSGGDRAAERQRVSRRRRRIWLAERGLGHGRVSQRALCARADRLGRCAPLHCNFHGLAGHCHDRRATLALAGSGGRNLRHHGFGPRRQWRRHEHQHHGTSAAALHGAGAEHVLLRRNVLQIVLGFLVGAVAQWNLVAGFAIIGMVYAVAFVTAVWPVAA